jgi:hypothetical protein
VLVRPQILMDCEGVDAVDQVRSSPATMAIAGACEACNPNTLWNMVGLTCMQAQDRGQA